MFFRKRGYFCWAISWGGFIGREEWILTCIFLLRSLFEFFEVDFLQVMGHGDQGDFCFYLL